MKIALTVMLSLFLSFSGVKTLNAQGKPSKYQILFVLDASGSMYGKWKGKLKMASAKKVLSKLVDSLDQLPNISMGLRVYGHQEKRDCEDTKLEVNFNNSASDAIKSALQRLNPKGITPIAYSLEKAAMDFPDVEGAKNIIILITDGVEECGGDPCAVSRKMQENRVVLKPFVIGLGIDENLGKKLDCLGRYYNADSEQSLNTILKVVVSNVLDNTTVQVKLLDHVGEASETDVTMSFEDRQTGVVWYNLTHTLNADKVPDKFVIDPSPLYRLKVHTLPPTYKKLDDIQPGKNNVINVEAPQGYLNLKMSGSMFYRDLKCLVLKSGTQQLVHVQDINSKVKYLEGKYDLKVLTTPVTEIKGVEITSKSTVQEVILNPGRAAVNLNGSFVGGLYRIEENRVEEIFKIDEDYRGGYLYLQPGHYRFVVRPSAATKTIYTKTKDFYIKSNGVSKITIN